MEPEQPAGDEGGTRVEAGVPVQADVSTTPPQQPEPLPPAAANTAAYLMHLTLENSGKPFPCRLTFCDSSTHTQTNTNTSDQASPSLPGPTKEAILAATLIHSTWCVLWSC